MSVFESKTPKGNFDLSLFAMREGSPPNLIYNLEIFGSNNYSYREANSFQT